jgi:hypothetical protein
MGDVALCLAGKNSQTLFTFLEHECLLLSPRIDLVQVGGALQFVNQTYAGLITYENYTENFILGTTPFVDEGKKLVNSM